MYDGRVGGASDRKSTFVLQVTALVDVFTILLVFLLKSYSTSPVQLTPSDKLSLPSSTSTKNPEEVLKMVVSQEGVFIEERKVASIEEGKFVAGETDAKDPQFIRGLFEELNTQAEKTRKIAAVNETVTFDGKVVVQADKKLTYALLKKVMYTAMIAGFADLKLAVISME